MFDDLVIKVQTLVYKIRQTYYLNYELEKICEALPKELKHLKLLNFVCTRWNSKYYMLKRIILLKEPINKLLQQEKDIIEELETLLITKEEWIMIEILVDYLSIFNKCSKYMEGEYPTLGYSISLYFRLWESTNSYDRDDVPVEFLHQFTSGLQACKEKIEKYYGTGTLFSFCAMAFDARIKDRFYNSFLWVEEKVVLIEK